MDNEYVSNGVGKLIDLISIHADYLMKYKLSDVSLDVTGSYLQFLLAEAGIKVSTIGIKMIVITLIAAL